MDHKFVTAGIWIRVGDRFPFEVGPDKTGEKIGVVRVGGHIEEGETPWECAVREAKEEAVLDILYTKPPATYRVDLDKDPTQMEKIIWDVDEVGCEQPIMVRTFGDSASAIFLASSQGLPMPGPTTRGLLLLSLSDIALLQQEKMTLTEFVEKGGQAIISEPTFDFDMPLHVSDIVFALSRIVNVHPELNN
jgi:8-oxo-dGTP pyrophosphatase MutT (NUDIX family)